jgi:hypothetical protein
MKSVRFASIKKLARELGVCPEGRLNKGLLVDACVEYLGSEASVLERLGLATPVKEPVRAIVDDLPLSIRGRTLKFNPLVDLGRLAAVIDNPEIYDAGYTYENGVRSNGPAQLAVLKQLYTHVERGQATTYTQSTKVSIGYTGRYFARQPSVQGTWRVLRHTILRDYIHADGRRIFDFDQENSHPCLLAQWCKAHDIDASCLQGYIDNKREYRARALEYYVEHGLVPKKEIPKEFVKKQFLKVLNGGELAKGACGLPLMREFAEGIAAIHEGIMRECPHWAQHARRKYTGSGYSNVEGTTCNYLMSHLEQLVWCAVYDSRDELGIDIICNQFDGWLILADPDIDKASVCRRIMDVITRDTGYVISVEWKPFDEGYEIDPAHIPSAESLKDRYCNDIASITPEKPVVPFTPDITIHEQYVRSVDPTNGVFLRSPTGTGKTQWIIDWLTSQEVQPRCLYLCNRIRLTNSIRDRMEEGGVEDVVHYKDLGSKTVGDRCVVITTLESLHKTEAVKFDYVIADEFESLMHQICAPNFKSVNRFALTLTRVLRECKIIAMDGLMTDSSIDSFLSSFPEHTGTQRVLNDVQNKTDESMTMVDSRQYLVSLITKACDERKSLAIATDNRAFALTMEELLRERTKHWERRPESYVYVGGDRSVDDSRRLSWFEQPGPLNTVTHLIYTPSIEAGVSIQRLGFDVQFNMFSHAEVSLTSCLQMTNRVRSKQASYTYISKPRTVPSANGLAHQMRQRTSQFTYDGSVGSIALLDLETNATPTMPISKLYIATEVRKSKQLAHARELFIQEAAVQGYRVYKHIVEEIDNPKLQREELSVAKLRKNIIRDRGAVTDVLVRNGEPTLLQRYMKISGIGLRDIGRIRETVGRLLTTKGLFQLSMRALLYKDGDWWDEASKALLRNAEMHEGHCDASDADRAECVAMLSLGSDRLPDTVKLVAVRVLAIVLGFPDEMPEFPHRVEDGWASPVQEYLKSCSVGGILSMCGYRGKLSEDYVLTDLKGTTLFSTWIIRRVFGITAVRLRSKVGDPSGYELSVEGLPFYWECGFDKCDMELQLRLYGECRNEIDRLSAEREHFGVDGSSYEAFGYSYRWEPGPKGPIIWYLPEGVGKDECPMFMGPVQWGCRRDLAAVE